MNEFEIKAAKQKLKDKNLIEIYKISEGYNIQEYGCMIFEVIIEYSYKEEIYLIGFSFREQRSKIELIEEEIKEFIENLEGRIYKSDEEIMSKEVMKIVSDQIEMFYIKNEKELSQSKYDELVNEARAELEYRFKKGVRAMDLYKKAMQHWKGWKCINE